MMKTKDRRAYNGMVQWCIFGVKNVRKEGIFMKYYEGRGYTFCVSRLLLRLDEIELLWRITSPGPASSALEFIVFQISSLSRLVA